MRFLALTLEFLLLDSFRPISFPSLYSSSVISVMRSRLTARLFLIQNLNQLAALFNFVTILIMQVDGNFFVDEIFNIVIVYSVFADCSDCAVYQKHCVNLHISIPCVVRFNEGEIKLSVYSKELSVLSAPPALNDPIIYLLAYSCYQLIFNQLPYLHD